MKRESDTENKAFDFLLIMRNQEQRIKQQVRKILVLHHLRKVQLLRTHSYIYNRLPYLNVQCLRVFPTSELRYRSRHAQFNSG